MSTEQTPPPSTIPQQNGDKDDSYSLSNTITQSAEAILPSVVTPDQAIVDALLLKSSKITKRRNCTLPRFHIGQVTKHNVQQIEKLNLATLPVVYLKEFYNELPKHHEFSRSAYLGEVLVGAICCRLEVRDNTAQLYIMTLGVLEPYRRHGIASHLLRYILNFASQRTELVEVYLHVWTENEAAILFYLSHGFKLIEKVVNYYAEIVPPDGYILHCPLPWKDHLDEKDSFNELHTKNYDATIHTTYSELLNTL